MNFEGYLSAGSQPKCCDDVDELIPFVLNLKALPRAVRGRFAPDDQFSMRSHMADHPIGVRYAKVWYSRARLFIHDLHGERPRVEDGKCQTDERQGQRQEDFLRHVAMLAHSQSHPPGRLSECDISLRIRAEFVLDWH